MNDLLVEMPSWLSIVPPLLAILLALVFREVITSLLISIIAGSIIIAYYSSATIEFFGLLKPVDYLVEAVVPSDASTGHISVIIFSFLIGGMVALISSNGSMHALVNRMSKYATSKKRGLLITWLMGVFIFFDDYANTLIVGNTMRPLTDRLKISREKLAYIVDSTAAPIAALALVTTWIGAELQFIADGVKGLENFPQNISAYSIFLGSLKYSFYPILALVFMLILIFTSKDFGPMLQAESRESDVQKNTGEQKEGKVWRGLLPILTMLFVTVGALLYTGWSDQIWNSSTTGISKKVALIIGNADSYKALLWASYTSLTVAVVISIPQLGLEKTIASVMAGIKKMFSAITILILAWCLAAITEDLGTAEFISSLMIGKVSTIVLPALTFILSALIAFSTGSSWGTMAIVYPVIIPTAWGIGMGEGLMVADNYGILLNVISCVLAGSVLGDHCSPISDTTILSSLASDCDHMAHVRTQLPYALVVGAVSLTLGTLLSALGVPILVCFAASVVILIGIVSYFGKTSQ